jgi:hypothetical protein
MTATDTLQALWNDPPAILRGAPFWSWNSKLNPDRLCQQIESMQRAGMGGFFMHSRYGLKTRYLGEEWFKCVSACVLKAEDLGMKAYLYDEDRWPSGPAGGFVTRDNPQYRLHYLCGAEEGKAADASADDKPEARAGDVVEAIARFAIDFDAGGLMKDYRRLREDEDAAGGTVFTFTVNTISPTSWTNDGGYLDTMNPEAVRAFIESTHAEYAHRYSNLFGGVIPAMFTDEPEYGFWIGGPHGDFFHAPWTLRLPTEFEKRRGYSLLERLPELLFPASRGEFSKTRHDYYRTATELFVESFSKQYGAWCEEHNLAMTGHVLLEGQIDVQQRAVGFTMPFYEYMQWPGMDLLCDQVNELTTAKQVSSVADQLGKERVLSECYGCTGWDWPLEGHKFLGDWQFAAGVNFRNHHLTHYSLAGGAKRDYPASIIDHSPWWKYYRTVEDYFARLTVIVTSGEPVRDVLVLHPQETAWGEYATATNRQHDLAQQLEERLERVIYTLSGEHYDWDFAAENLLAKYGEAKEDGFHVGEMTYKLVIAPYCKTLRRETADLLNAYLDAGGQVLFIGDTPSRVDGEEDAAAQELVQRAAVACGQNEEFMRAVEERVERRVSVTEGGKEQRCIWTMLRETDEGRLLFLQSHDREKGHTVRVAATGEAPVGHWDLMTGVVQRVEATEENGRLVFDLELPPTGSAVISYGVDLGSEPVTFNQALEVESETEVSGPFDIELTEDNTLPLDYCVYRIEEASWSAPVPTLQADADIRKRYGLDPRGGSAHQPWYLYAMGAVDTSPRGACELKWTFHARVVPSRCRLALENPGDYAITVNGAGVNEVDGYWVDEDIQTIDITGHIQQGENEVLLRFDYRPDMEIEDAYLVGDFGVALKDGESVRQPGAMTLVEMPKRLELGSWIGQGLDFYGGSVLYKMGAEGPEAGKRLLIDYSRIDCACAAAHCNGNVFPTPWRPFVADVTAGSAVGPNDIAVEVIGGRKNILGPLHTPWGPGTGPDAFDPRHPAWKRAYQLKDHGLMGPVKALTVK